MTPACLRTAGLTSGGHPHSHPTSNARLPWAVTSECVRSLNRAGESDPRWNVHLSKDVVKVSLDRLLAEEQFRCDLGVCLAIDDQPCDL